MGQKQTDAGEREQSSYVWASSFLARRLDPFPFRAAGTAI